MKVSYKNNEYIIWKQIDWYEVFDIPDIVWEALMKWDIIIPTDWLDIEWFISIVSSYKKSFITQELTPRQIRLALIQSGVSLSNIDAMIDNMEEPQKSVIKTLREYSLSYSRDDEILIQFATQLWMNEQQLDDIFILWATL